MAFVDFLGKPSFSGDFDCFRRAKISGEGGIRTCLKIPPKSALFEQGGAESGTWMISDPGLASLIDAWAQLPENMKAGILAIVKAASE